MEITNKVNINNNQLELPLRMKNLKNKQNFEIQIIDEERNDP